MLVIPAFLLSGASTLKSAVDDQLVLSAEGASDYQLVLPDASASPKIADWLKQSADLVRDAFSANGADIKVVTKSKHDPSKPGIYLGATKFMSEKGVSTGTLSSWGYVHKVVGKNVIIAGPDKATPDSPDDGLGLQLGTVKGVCDFLREYAGVRFLYPGSTGIEFLSTEQIAVPANLNKMNTPAVRFNYCLNRSTGLYEIANNMFPPETLSKKTVKAISVKNAGLFDNEKDYKVLDGNIAYTYNWGTFHPLAYSPKTTPRVVGAVMKRLVADEVTGIIKDGFGKCFGLEGAVYYISGRLLDDPAAIHADVVYALLQEYYEAAFGEASAPMKRFYDNLLYEGLELYSEWLDVGAPAEYFTDDNGKKQRYISDPLHYLSYIYSVNLIADLENELDQTKKLEVHFVPRFIFDGRSLRYPPGPSRIWCE